MGSKLSVEEALHLSVNELGFEQTNVHSWRLDNTVHCVCLVEEKWLRELRAGEYSKPQSFPGSSYERFLLLQPSNEEIPKPWSRVSLKIFRKPLKKLRIPNALKNSKSLVNDSFADLMSYVSTENFKNYLLQASKKYSSVPLFEDNKTDVTSGKDVILYFAKHVYNLEIIKLNDTSVDEKSEPAFQTSSEEENSLLGRKTTKSPKESLSGLVPVCGVIESKNAYFIIEPFVPHSLQDVVWFSPSVMSSTIAKPLFLLYQILKLFETFHNWDHFCSVNSLQDILVRKCLWLVLSSSNVNLGDEITEETEKNHSSSAGRSFESPSSESALSFPKVGSMEIPIPIQMNALPLLVDSWIRRELSNFDYLMALNTIAGRRLGDPNYHPVLPWVTDFTRPKGSFRDLTKSKFRINKGDHQLDLTFKAASDTDGDLTENPPHHVSGVLSEITYHVYRARRTPKSVLQKHVRAKWEPNEYPSNMQRLQEWTPDECIPEFYADPTIFKSIHADLPDLGVPTWAKTPEEFVQLHREALESEYVCSHLHHWIDLTFGYKLMGLAAEKAKNVYLHLVDHHQSVANHGVLQLFEEPHPSQHHHHEMVLYPSTVNFEDGLDHEMRTVAKQDEGLFGALEGLAEFTGEEGLPSSSWDNVDVDLKVETGEDELTASTSNFKKQKWGRPNFPAFLRLKDSVELTTDVSPSIDSLPISLPIGYDPLEEFDQVQLLTKFKLQSKQHDLVDAKALTSYSQAKVLPRAEIPETARHKEIQNLCSMIMEMFLPAKMRLLSSDLSQKEKFIAAKRVFSAGKVAVLGVLRDGVKTLFDEGCGFHNRHGLPPLTPELLLQQHVNIFPFPSYFKRLHEFLVEFHNGRPSTAGLSSDEDNEAEHIRVSNLIEGSYYLRQVEITVKHLPELLSDLNEEGLDLLMSYLNPLFCYEETQLQAFLHLFDPLAEHLGPKKARKVFLKLLLKHYDVGMSSASVALFHQSFLSKLIMRFGMDQFLNHFITFIVDALNLCTKDVQENAETISQDEVQGAILEDEKQPEKGCENNMETKLETSWNNDSETVDKGNNDKDRCSNSDTIFPFAVESNGDGPLEVSGGDLTDGTQTSRVQTRNLEPEENVNGFSVSHQGQAIPRCAPNDEVSYSGEFKVESITAGLMDEKEDVFNDDEAQEDEEETIERSEDISSKTFSNVDPNSAEDWYNDDSVDSDFSLERSVSFQSENLESNDTKQETILGGEDVNCELEIPEAAANSLCWLSPRLGPLLTSNYITKPLLLMLIKCYVGVLGFGDKGASVGDANAKWILHCLGRFTEIYGEAVILDQYLPFIMSKINIVSEHVSVKGEANLAGALALVRHCVLYISRRSLLEQFEILCHQTLHQVLCLLSSGTISFASGAPARTSLALLIIDVLSIICDILERDEAKDLLAPLIGTFFSAFDQAFSVPVRSESDVAPVTLLEATVQVQPCAKEIQQTFTASLAYNTYIPLCKNLGDTYMEATLCNYDMIWQLCCSMDKGLSNHTPPMNLQPMFVLSDDEQETCVVAPDSELSAHATNKRASGVSFERSYSPTTEMKKEANTGSLERSATTGDKISTKSSLVSSRQHLAGNWLKYWKRHLGKRNRIDGHSFSQLKLQTFTGHSDAIKDLCIQDSEHLFLSASRDKTVKLWLLSNHGDGTGQSACSWTTYDHRKSVFAVDMVDVMRRAVSCDGSVHIWDLPTGSSILRVNFPKSNQAVAMTTLPSSSSCVVAAMQNASVRFIDVREGNFGHTWKVTSNNLAGQIRSMCVNREGTSMAVGFSSGSLSIIDLRGGILTRQWKAYEADVIQVKPYTNSSLVTSSSTQKMELWGHDGMPIVSLPLVNGSGESVQNICVHDKVIVSSTANNRIGWHTFNDKEPAYWNVRLGNDTFKGNLTCFGVLPLNRSYLFGSDNGNITLMA